MIAHESAQVRPKRALDFWKKFALISTVMCFISKWSLKMLAGQPAFSSTEGHKYTGQTFVDQYNGVHYFVVK